MPSARAEPLPQSLGKSDVPPRRSALRWTWEYFRQMISLGRFVVTGLLVCPLCAAALFLSRGRIPASAGQRFIQWLFHHWLVFSQKIGVFEIQLPPAEALAGLRGTILAPNHPGQLDAVMILSLVPRTVCVMRASLMKNPWLGGAARLARFVSNDRGPTLVRDGTEKIRQGENLLIFPEGTRTFGSPLNPFKHGCALIATKTGAPIQTFLIEREGPYLSKGVSLLAPEPLPIRLRVHLGEKFHPREGEEPQALTARLEAYFRERITASGRNILLKSPPRS